MRKTMADLSGVKLELVDSVEKAGQFMTWLSERHGPNEIIAVDTETGQREGRPTKDALSPWHGRLRLAQVGDKYTGWAIPWDGWNGVFHEAMNRFEGQIICHNIAFEARWFALQSDFKVPWHRMHDSMIAAHIINPLESVALKTLTSKYVDGRSAALQRIMDEGMAKNGWDWGTVPINWQPYWSYGALDTVLTAHLWDVLAKDVGPTGPYRLVYDLEMAARRVCTQMELNGARVDLEYSERKYKELHDYSQSVKAWGDSAYSSPGNKRSVTSTRDLIKIFDGLGAEWEPEDRTPSGLMKMDKDQLVKFQAGYPGSQIEYLATQVLKMRKAAKLADTYLLNFINLEIDGLVHPNIRTLGARTGRMSITEPALQTLGKGERTIRDAFIARDPETECLISSDLDQVEFRMFASLSEDPQLIDLFLKADWDADAGDENGDAFTYIMRELYSDQSASKKDKRRKLIKGYIYGRLYGAGVAKQALTAGVPEYQMREVADAFDRNYPGAKVFTQKVEHEGMQRFRSEGQGYVLTSTGRRLPCDEGKIYTLVNYLIQGGAAEVFKLDLLKLDAAGLTDYLVVPVHDEIVMSVPKTDVHEMKRVVKECMTTREGWAVPLTAGCDGPAERWGDLIE
jgi:DNA polymerase-1